MTKNDNNKQRKFVLRTVMVSAALLAAMTLLVIIGVKTWPERTLRRIDRLIEAEDYTAAEQLVEHYEAKIDGANLSEQKKICSYNTALNAIDEGDTDRARYYLTELDGYMDTEEMLKECDYVDACSMMEAGEYRDARALFFSIADYKDAQDKIRQLNYAIAEETLQNGDLAEALEIFLEIKDYKDAQSIADDIAMEVTGAKTVEEAYNALDGLNLQQMQKVAQLTDAREGLPHGVLAVGAHHTVGLKDGGTVLAAGLDDDGQCQVETWENIGAVDAGAYHTVGLTTGGKVLATGSNKYGQCDVDEWENVVQIAAGAYDTYALLKDGTVVSTGFAGGGVFDGKSGIRQIGAGSYAAVCIDNDGRVLASHPSLYIDQKGAVEADVSTGYLAALMPDGTMAGSIEGFGDWEDIIAISAGSVCVLAVDADGGIEAYFFSSRDKVDIDKYDNAAAVAAGGAHSAILLFDGSVIAFGRNESGECDVQDWDLISDS